MQPNTGNQTKSFVELGSFKTKTYQTIADHKWYFLGEYGKNSNNFEWSCEGDVLLTCNNEVTATFSGYYTPFSKEKCDPTQFALSPSTFPSTSNPSN